MDRNSSGDCYSNVVFAGNIFCHISDRPSSIAAAYRVHVFREQSPCCQLVQVVVVTYDRENFYRYYA